MSGQIAIDAFISEATLAETVSANPKAWGDLVAGDVVEVWWHNGAHLCGWCAEMGMTRGAGPRPCWEVEAQWVQHGDGPRRDAPRWDELSGMWSTRFFELARNYHKWTWVRHDPEWALHPTPDEMAAWLRERLASCRPFDSLNFSTEMHNLWPFSRYDAGRDLYRQALRERFSDPTEYLADKRWLCHKLPRKALTQLEGFMRLGPDERAVAIRNLSWSDGPNHDACLAFCGINDDYELWHMAHTDDAQVLVALAERFSLTWRPRKREVAP